MTDEVAETIGERVAAMVPDGACIQTGIGAIPQAILGALADHNDLGMHGGLIDDAGLALIQRGVITGNNKSIDRGLHITGIAMGTHGLYEASRMNPLFALDLPITLTRLGLSRSTITSSP